MLLPPQPTTHGHVGAHQTHDLMHDMKILPKGTVSPPPHPPWACWCTSDTWFDAWHGDATQRNVITPHTQLRMGMLVHIWHMIRCTTWRYYPKERYYPLHPPTHPRMGMLVHIRHMMHNMKMQKCQRLLQGCENTCHQNHGPFIW